MIPPPGAGTRPHSGLPVIGSRYIDRLTSAVLPSSSYGYGYDTVDNRLTKTVGANSDSYTYSPTSNQIASIFNAVPASVSLTDQADGYVIADAVMLLPPGSPPNSAVWTPNVPQAGTYQVYAWWTAGSNRATNATYTVTNAQGSTAVAVNQQTNGGAWNLLGTFSLAPGTTDTITLTDQANGYVIADAIRLVPVQTQAQMQLYYVEVDHLNTPRLVGIAQVSRTLP